MDAIYGVTKELLAELMGKYSELKAKFGERQGEAEFDQFLAQKGLDRNTWAHAHNGWQDRFRADPTGRAEAEFHMMLAQASQRAHFGDVPDMSQDTVEGITLDTYAQITVAISRQGADGDAVVRQFGLQGIEHWQRANAAWGAKMGADTSHRLTMQYGQLYQKYAGPSFQQEMVQQTADILAARNQPQDVISEPEVELTPDLCLQKMQSPSRNERWKYARHYAHMADLGNVPDKAQAIRTVTPHLIEMIEQHDEHTTSDAENAITKLWDLEVRNDDVRGAVGRCLNRAREKLQSLQAAFAPIQNQAVPERVTLQSRIQDYTSLVETMAYHLDQDWTPAHAAAPAGFAPNPAFGHNPSFAPNPGFPGQGAFPAQGFAPAVKAGGGFPKWILAPLIIVVVGGGIAATKLRAKAASSSASTTAASVSAAKAAASASAAATTPPKAPTPAATEAAKTAAPAASSAAPATPAAKKKKK